MDDPKGDGVYECSEDPGEIFHKKPACGVLWNFDVTPVILSIYLVSHPMGWGLLGNSGRENDGEIPDRNFGIGRISVEIDMSPRPYLQTHMAGNPQPHYDGRQVPQIIIGEEQENVAVASDRGSTTVCVK